MDKQEFLDRYTKHLNDKQLEAVQAVDGAVLLLAVPGSGKTKDAKDQYKRMLRKTKDN